MNQDQELIVFVMINLIYHGICYLYTSQLSSVLDINVRVLDTVINVIIFC